MQYMNSDRSTAQEKFSGTSCAPLSSSRYGSSGDWEWGGIMWMRTTPGPVGSKVI